MDPKQRFKTDRACPVCGGHKDLPQGKGRRCYGFISDDGLYAHCTREEHAGRLDRNGNSNTYAHPGGRLSVWKGARRRTCTGPTPSGKQSGRSERGLLSRLQAGTAVSAMALPVRQRGAGGLRGAVGQAGRRQGNPAPGYWGWGLASEGHTQPSTSLQLAGAGGTP